jgi:hypothetical protein
LYGLCACVREVNLPFSMLSRDLPGCIAYDGGQSGQGGPVFEGPGETSGGSLRLSLGAKV